MSDYKYKEEIMDDVSFEPAFQYPHEVDNHNGKLNELDEVYDKAEKYEALLTELEYLRKVNHDLTWQRDTDEEHETKAKALDGVKELINAHDCAIEEESGLGHLFLLDLKAIIKYAESGDSEC